LITAAQAKLLIRQLIAGLRHAGIQKGDSVLIHSFNNIYYPILVLATLGCGAISTGTNPSYTSYELGHAIRSCDAKLILCDPDVLGGGIITAAKESKVDPSRILLLDSSPTCFEDPLVLHKFQSLHSWRSLLKHGEEDWVRFDSEKISRETTALLLFSSGTTGLPKLTQLSHYNFIAQHTLVFEYKARPYTLKRLIALPMFHAATAPSTHVSPLKGGQPQFIMRRFDPTAFFDMAEKFEITDLVLVPPQVTALLAHPLSLEEKRKKFSSVRIGWAGAAPLDAVTQNRFRPLLPAGAPFTQIWGMTEVCCFGSVFPYPEDDDTASVGRFLPNIDVKLLDDDGRDMAAYDTPGELAVRGPTVTRGYVGIPRERDFDDEGYFRTGDILYMDSKTKLWYIIDRKKELIKVRGFQVAPAEIEGVLLEHSSISDAAVIGIKSLDGSSELPRAYVVRKEGASLTKDEVRSWVEGRLAKYKKLEGGVSFVDGIPKTPSGKILKRVLREMAARERGPKL
jgi:4-coumarate--CoA ligase